MNKTKKTLADEYGVCRKTLRKWMDATEYEFLYILTPSWCKLIYEEFGYPEGIDESDYAKVRLPRQYRHLFD
jgi:hypothetical protein